MMVDKVREVSSVQVLYFIEIFFPNKDFVKVSKPEYDFL